MRHTMYISIFLAVLSICLVLPVIICSGVKELKYNDKAKQPIYYDETGVAHKIRRYFCSDNLGNIRAYVSGSIILFSFIIPCFCIMFFYGRIVLRLRKQQRTMLQSRIPIRRITIYTMLVTFFHIGCLIPFWVPQVYVSVTTIKGAQQMTSLLRYIKISHLFPYISASINWVFYAQMNSQFKKGLVLVTERMIRKRTKSLQQNGNGRDKDTWDGIGLELLSQDDVIAMCPNCEAQLTFRNSNGKKTSLIPPLSPYAI
ncbi:hypothetical protein WR25_25830 isoform B [Diploscapter pachys]|uniref:G-protein coupled receptors family 1 profile domain-containing protein n=1 Tax=Diploscapter pachys TaxID=2018661 RepID=A0A2A2JLY5_9BILA|nr:hypothetical protein WR25_25830 isoform B [Diploscapter pachys]